MRRRLALLLASSLRSPHPRSPRRPPGSIAITVDDLPVHGTLPAGMSRVAIARSYLATLKAHHVLEAFGFVNAARIGDEPASEEVLPVWRKAGYPLGNHTATHFNLDPAPSVEAWEADVIAGEPPLARYMTGRDWHYLRFPYLATGSTPARHDAAAAFLAARGYKIADVSVSFDDWACSDTYAHCLARHDTAVIAAMKTRYLAGVDAGIARMKAVSQQVYGRMIPQVLLTHIGGWSAMMLLEVMRRLDAAGARYVPLATAERDPAYAKAARVPGGGGIMERHAQAAGIALPPPAPLPATGDPSTLCR